jgi:hypothetical protein
MDTFCVLPWYSSELPGNSPCCLLPKNTNIEQVKTDLLAGVKSPACAKCWQLEESGQRSRRQQENIFLDYKLDRDIDKIEQDCIDNKHETLLYQITTSNLCNQACVSCGSIASTKWAELEAKMGEIPSKYFRNKVSNFNINYKSAKRIELLGGEPFFDSTTFDILEKLIENNNIDCFISVVTNGSVRLNNKQLDILTRFTNLNICISIDGVGPVFEYMRWPASWSILLENIKQYRSIAKNLSVSYTISSLNAFYYDKTVEWFKETGLTYNHNIVTFPQWLSLANSPVEFKELFNKNKFIASFLDSPTPTNISEYSSHILKQDTVKNIKISDYLPEIAAIIFDNSNT